MRKRKYTALVDMHIDNSVACVRNVDDVMPMATIHNIVATVRIVSSVSPVNLQYLAQILPNSYYNRQRFAAITIRLARPNCTALLFSSGKLVLTGCSSWNECNYASMNVVNLLRAYVPDVDFLLVENCIQNIVAHVSIPLRDGCKLDLSRLYEMYGVQCTYQPQLFPGLIFRPESSPVVLICFYSGNVVVTGGKSVDDIEQGWKRLWPLMKTFVV